MNTSLPNTTTIPLGKREIRIDLGELILPAIILIFGALYYFDTRGLPKMSMLYAGPLLYITMAFAIITIADHAISIDGEERSVEEYRKERHTEEETAEKSQYYNRRTATGLVVITLVYLVLLTQMPRIAGDYTYILPTTLYLGTSLYLFGERSPVRLVLYSVGFALLTWGVFISWLKVPL